MASGRTLSWVAKSWQAWSADSRAASRACAAAGQLTKMAMMAITTSNSIRVNPRRRGIIAPTS